MSRGREARPRTRPADPCAFCGARVPRCRSTDEGDPKLCGPCDSGSSYQFTLKRTAGMAHPFAENRWRRPGVVDAEEPLRLGGERRRTPRRRGRSPR